MGHGNSNVPLDPVKNIEKLESMYADQENKLTLKTNLRKSTQERYDKLQKLLDATGAPETLNEEEMNLACTQEQLKMVAQIELEDLDKEIHELRGLLKWNARRQRIVNELIARSDKLTYKPFAKLSK